VSASWVRKLNESDSRLHKEDVIRQAYEAAILGNEISKRFLHGLRTCYNPFVTFGVKQIPSNEAGLINAENPYEEFAYLLTRLQNRKLTGNAARDAIQDIAYRFDSEEWDMFLAPILRRDMRSGISEKTINKIVKNTEYEIPTFGCQLATNCEGRPEMRGIKRLEPKLDGVRVLMVFDTHGGMTCSVISYSRNGKVFENFTHIENQLLENAENILRCLGRDFSSGFVFDGEIVGNSFQELMRQARRKTDVQNDDSVFHIFDILPLDDFKHGHWNAQLHRRIGFMEKLNPIINSLQNVEFLPHAIVNLDSACGVEALHTYANNMVASGFEGIMIKNLSAPYECKRNTFWMKYKPTITVDLQVMGVAEGTGRNKGRLGAIICNGIDDGKEITVNVGSGFNDSDRDNLWADRKLVIGSTVEILADAITQNRDGTYSLRFPRFVRFRDDK